MPIVVIYGPPVPFEDQYINKCRYYLFEADSAPKGVNELMWEYEKVWVDSHFSKEGMQLLKNYVREYKSFGLGRFRQWDGVPISLKALLWNRYSHWNYANPEDFKDWYKNQYYNLRLNEL